MEENQAKKKNKLPLVLVLSIAVIIVLGIGIFIIQKNGGDKKVPTASTKEDLVTVEQRSLLMTSGETKALSVKGDDVKYSSSNEAVAKVDASGKVTAVSKGTALITIVSGDETEYCGVLVDMTGTMADITNQKASKLISEVQLEEPGEISGFAIDFMHNAFYFSQPYGTTSYGQMPSDVVVNKVQKNDKGVYAVDSWMRFYESGTGRIAIDKDGVETDLYLESNGSLYGSGNTLAKVRWENEKFDQGEFGTTYTLEGVQDSASPTIDHNNNLLLIYDESNKTYLLYDKEMMEKDGSATYLHSIKIKGEQTPVVGIDESEGFYNAAIKGVALYDGYIYQISGSRAIYISVFDMNGILQYCRRVPDFADMEVRTPAGIVVENGKIYIAVGDKEVSAKSLLGLLSLGITEGTEIEIICEGPSEKEDLEAVYSYIEHL
jgi:phosphotransferase system HPr (HPr) family protein